MRGARRGGLCRDKRHQPPGPRVIREKIYGYLHLEHTICSSGAADLSALAQIDVCDLIDRLSTSMTGQTELMFGGKLYPADAGDLERIVEAMKLGAEIAIAKERQRKQMNGQQIAPRHSASFFTTARLVCRGRARAAAHTHGLDIT